MKIKEVLPIKTLISLVSSVKTYIIHLIVISLMVVANVILTLINVAGYMWLWGLSIETAAAILLTIALGLAVDYSAHIAHAFMAAEGDNRNERMRRVKSQ